MANTSTFGGRFALFLLMLFLAGTAAAQNCGGKERWGPKDGTDPEAPNIDLTNITSEAVTDLVAIHQPHLPVQGDNTTRVVPDETHAYRVQARLVKWKHEQDDDDYHLVLTDDTLNGPPGPDTARIPSLGFAIKVLGISAEKLLPIQQEDTQDFLFLNQPAYIAADVRDYKSLMQAIDGGPWYKALALVRNLKGLLYRMKALPKDNPLNTKFWGVAPFRLGNIAVKYLIRPSQPEPTSLPARLSDDYLKNLVKAHVEKRSADFEFFLQKRLRDGAEKRKMPIEDYSVAWDEMQSVPVHVGRLRIPPQKLDDAFDQEQGEHLSFSPWNTTRDLRPLGSLNRARRVIYKISSRNRQEINRARDSGNSSH